MLRSLLVLGVVSGFVMAFTGTVRAQAPDYSICDGLSGAAWGLCRAGVAVGCADEPPSGSPESCAQIEGNYEAVAGAPPPWAAEPCPCIYDDVAKDSTIWTTASDIRFTCVPGRITVVTGDNEFGAPDELSADPLQFGSLACFIRSSPGEANPTDFVMVDMLSEDQFASCRQDLISYGNALAAIVDDVSVDDQCLE